MVLMGHAHALVMGILSLQYPAICSGDQSSISLLATTSRNSLFTASRQRFGRNAAFHACWSAA